MSAVAGPLHRLVASLRGCRGAFAMDYDGLPLESVRPSEAGPDLDAIGAEVATVLREARQAAQDLGLGPLRGLTVRAVGPTLLFQEAGPDVLLVAVLEGGASAAAGRRALAQAAREHPAP